MFQHTAARRRLDVPVASQQQCSSVSTHSRPKAAGSSSNADYNRTNSFNTQPPEGGWLTKLAVFLILFKFQHTAARRRLDTGSNRNRIH